MEQKKTIAFDTNMILAAAQFKTDVFAQAREIFGKKIVFAVPEKVFEELENLGKKNSKMKKTVSLALEIMKKNKIKKIKSQGENTDASLEKLAAQGLIIATNDKILRKKIKAFGSHIYLKQNRIIAVE